MARAHRGRVRHTAPGARPWSNAARLWARCGAHAAPVCGQKAGRGPHGSAALTAAPRITLPGTWAHPRVGSARLVSPLAWPRPAYGTARPAACPRPSPEQRPRAARRRRGAGRGLQGPLGSPPPSPLLARLLPAPGARCAGRWGGAGLWPPCAPCCAGAAAWGPRPALRRPGGSGAAAAGPGRRGRGGGGGSWAGRRRGRLSPGSRGTGCPSGGGSPPGSRQPPSRAGPGRCSPSPWRPLPRRR